MKMSKNYRRLCAVLGLSLVCGAGALTATSGSRNIPVTYRDIKISYNGQTKTVTDEAGRIVEPFAYNGTTFVPIRGVSQILGVTATWDSTTGTVVLTGNTNSSLSSSEAAQYMDKIASLQTQLTAAQNELARLKATGTSTTTPAGEITVDQLKAAETALEDEYANRFSGINFEFDLKRSSSKFTLNLSYNKSTANTAFGKLSKKNIDNFLEEVCETLTAKHPGFSIDGSVSYNSTDKYTFNYSKSGVYSGSAVIELDEDDIEELIEDSKNLDSSLVDTITINDSKVDISDSKQTITCSLYVKTHTDDDKKKWNAKSSDKSLKNALSDLAEEIQSEFSTDYSVIFYIYDGSSDERIATYDKDGDLSLRTWKLKEQ